MWPKAKEKEKQRQRYQAFEPCLTGISEESEQKQLLRCVYCPQWDYIPEGCRAPDLQCGADCGLFQLPGSPGSDPVFVLVKEPDSPQNFSRIYLLGVTRS